MLKLTLVVCAIGCQIMACDPPVARDQKAKPMLKCALRRISSKRTITIGGKPLVFEMPDAGEVTITNISNENVDIRSQWGWLAHLDLRVKDPAGVIVKTVPIRAYIATKSLCPEPDILKPGQARQTELGLLAGVSDEKRIPGAYRVQAVYTIDNKEYTSDWVEVKWPTKEK